MSAKRSKIIKGEKGMRVTVYPWTHPRTGASRWRFAWRDGKSWRYSTYKTKAEAEEGAAMRLAEIEEGGLVWSGLSDEWKAFLGKVRQLVSVEDHADVLEYISARKISAEISESVGRFLQWKEAAAGEVTPYLRHVNRVLKAMGEHFKGKAVADVHLPELAAWVAARGEGKGWKVRRDERAYVVELWKWFLREGIAGRAPVTVAERLPTVAREEVGRRVLTPDELERLLGAVGRPWRAWVVLGAFAGMRPQEICPAAEKRRGKRGLHCEEIDFQFGVIRLPACVSKGGKRARIIPISPALRAGLEWAGILPGRVGAVVSEDPVKAGELRRLGKEVFGEEGWPQDALRHSYGSYRNAILRSMEQVAEEMGTSVAMLHRHYHNPKAEAEGVDWFAVRPVSVPICSDGIEVNVAELANLSAKKARRIRETA
jgi:integrase